MDNTKARKLELFFSAASTLILLGSIAIAVLWMSYSHKYNFEPVLVLLGLLYAAIPQVGKWLVRRLNRKIEKERLTLPYALAYGYLKNYLAPVLRRIRKETDDPNRVKFYVYIPRSLDELKDESIDEILTELENQRYELGLIELDFPGQKRKKDYRTAKRSMANVADPKYFDFPTTMLTLDQVVKYKLDTQEGHLPTEQEENLGERYINDFRNCLETMLKEKAYDAIRNNIFIVDGGLDFLGEVETSSL